MPMFGAERRLEAGFKLLHSVLVVGEANKMADNINSLSSILSVIHYYINIGTVILPLFTYLYI